MGQGNRKEKQLYSTNEKNTCGPLTTFLNFQATDNWRQVNTSILSLTCYITHPIETWIPDQYQLCHRYLHRYHVYYQLPILLHTQAVQVVGMDMGRWMATCRTKT